MSYISDYYSLSATSGLLNNMGSVGGASSGLASVETNSSLMSVYSNIYGKNTVTKTGASDYAVSVKKGAADIKAALEKINKKGEDSVFNKVSAESSDSAVTATYSGSEKKEDIKVGVSQLASAQVNEGTSLNSKSQLTTSSYSMTISTSGGKSKSFYISSSTKSTTKEIQEALAKKINDSDIGVTASVKTDEKSGKSQLILEGAESGKGNDFYVSGGLAEAFGVDKTTTAAQDALFTVDGEQMYSETNKVELDDGTILSLNAVTKDDAVVKFNQSDKDALNATRELVNSYNALMKTAKGFDDSGAEKLAKELNGLVKTYSAGLERIGITKNKNGYLEIDEDKMKDAAESGELGKFFGADSSGNENYGFAYRLGRIADKAEKDPKSYLSLDGKKAINSEKENKKDNAETNSKYYSRTRTNSLNYINNYYKLSSASMLFDALF